MRTVGGILAGIVVFVLILVALEWIAHQIFPATDRGMPNSLLAFVAFAYFLSSALGGIVAARISRQHWTAWLIAVLVAAGAAYSLTLVPHPLWMQIASIVAPLLGGLIASRLAEPKRVDAAL